MQNYFSQIEFAGVVATATSLLKMQWFMLSGDLLNEQDSAKLENMIANFLRARGHRSFQQHQAKSA